MRLVELQQVLREADPAAVLVAPHILDRIVQQAFALPRVVWTVPHRKSFIVDRQALFQHVDQAELQVAPDQLVPPTVILLAYPSLDDLNDQQESLLLKYWRRLFHASVHKVLEERSKDGTLTAETIRQRVEAIGRTEFEEIRTVLTQDDYLPATADELQVYIEFAAVFLELHFFSTNLLRAYFPGIRNLEETQQLLSQDVDGSALFRSTRLRGAPDPVIRTATNAEEAHEYYSKLIQGARRATLAGNTVRSAILKRRAARVAPGGMGISTQSDSIAELEQLTRRLQKALQLSDAEAAEWRMDLPKLLDKADQGTNPVEAALLFDLQKICVDHEQDIYALDLMEWLTSGFRRPIKRPLPSLRVVSVTRHLRSAVQRLTMARLCDEDRQHLARLLETALRQSEDRLRTRFRPVIRDSLLDAGLSPRNAPEETAFNKVVEEMLDRISASSYLTFSDVRDVISRNQLKLPDLQDPQDFIHGDQLLRLDRRLCTLLDGVYKPSELYLRWLERFAALNFGTSAGRWLTAYVSMPLVIAFLVLFAGKLVYDDVAGLVQQWMAPTVKLAEGPFPNSTALDAKVRPAVLDGQTEFGQAPLTVEFWAKLFSQSSDNVLVANENSSPYHWQLQTQKNTGFPMAILSGADDLVSNRDICDGEWHYLALTYDKQTARLYVDGELADKRDIKPRPQMMFSHPKLVVGAAIPQDTRSRCDGWIGELRISNAVRLIEGKPTEAFGYPASHDREGREQDSTRGLCHFSASTCTWVKPEWDVERLQAIAFLKDLQFWALWLLLYGLILALIRSEALRQRIVRGARACWQPIRYAFSDLPRQLIDLPIIRQIGESWAFQLAYWYLLLPALVAVPIFYVLYPLLERTDHAVGVCMVLASVLAFILVNSRFGQATQALFKQTAIWSYDLFRSGFIAGLVRLVSWVFRELRDTVETVIFAVDEWLRFRKGETGLSMVVRTVLGVLWFPFSYLLRFYFIVLIEPCLNPPKLAISSIAAKIVYPLFVILHITDMIKHPWGGVWFLVWAFLFVTFWLLPDAFAFLLWEMKANYRLYRANRPLSLKPVEIGPYGETVRGLLQPGFHSGTIPRLYRKLRWAERRAFQTGSWRSVRMCLQSLHEVELSAQRFVERDFVYLLCQGPGWKDAAVTTGPAHLASNRISVELRNALYEKPVCLEFEFWSGWLVAGIRDPGWLSHLQPEQLKTFTTALAGLYKLAGVDVVREQVRRSLPVEIERYDLIGDGLLLRRGKDGSETVRCNLREPQQPVVCRNTADDSKVMVVDARRILFSRQPISWDRWVHSWQKNGEKHPRELFDEPLTFLPGV